MKSNNSKATPKRAKQNQKGILILYLILALSVVGYAMTSSILIGAAAFVILIVTLASEFKFSVKEEGMQKSIYDIMTAIVAVVVIWIILIILLGTSSPVNVVASCSMLPTLHRGDLVILHGIPNITSFLSSHNIPIVNVSPQEMNHTLSSMNSEFLAFFAYNPSNSSKIGEIVNIPDPRVQLYNTKCIDTYTASGQPQDIGKCAVPSQAGNLIRYNYSIERVDVAGIIQYIPQTNQIAIGNTIINENYSNPIVVYQTTVNDSFSGDIVHRVFAAIRSGKDYYILTKGDNNGGLDIQFLNYPAKSGAVLGYVIADIPVVGYLRLIISGQLSTPAGCNSTIIR
ncbi:MAG: hypothetical protein ACYCO0_01690 [Candidatus Micrarchaeaceae archaeon]